MNPAGGQLRQGMQHKGLYSWQWHCEVWPGPLPQHGGHEMYGIALRRLHCHSQVLKVNELEEAAGKGAGERTLRQVPAGPSDEWKCSQAQEERFGSRAQNPNTQPFLLHQKTNRRGSLGHQHDACKLCPTTNRAFSQVWYVAKEQ